MPRFLVLDDDMSFAIGIRTVLRKEGLDVTVASSVLCGLKELEAMDVDVIVVDTSMARVDAFQAINAVRRRTPNVPIVAASGQALRDSLDMTDADARFAAANGLRAKTLLTATRLVSIQAVVPLPWPDRSS